MQHEPHKHIFSLSQQRYPLLTRRKKLSTMTAHTTDHIVYMPSTMTYRDAPVQHPTGTSRPSGLEAVFAKALRYVVSLPRRQAVKNELSRLSDRELADIGLTRSQIADVFSRVR